MFDFSKKTLRALALRGITVTGLVAIPDMASAMPFANADRGSSVNDNGTGRIWSFAQVMEAAR